MSEVTADFGVGWCHNCNMTYPLGHTHICGTPITMEPGFKTQPSELELKIRKEVMDAIEELVYIGNDFADPDEDILRICETIKDRLNLLWGE